MISKEQITDIQTALVARGINIGSAGVDGKFGDKTYDGVMEAIRRIVPKPVEQTGSFHAVPVPSLGDAAKLVAKQPKASRSITEIVIHCAATHEGQAVSVDTIRSWHKARGWNDIGYHYVVLIDGTPAVGRPEAKIGAHVEGHNTGTLGICYVGGVDAKGRPKDTRTDLQKQTLTELCEALIAKYPTIKKITGHNQYAAKACPSFDVRQDPLSKLV